MIRRLVRRRGAMVAAPAVLIFSCGISSTVAAQDVRLDNYTCAEFISDTQNQSDGARLARSLMMISWAAGFAAAFDKGSVRADATAITLIAATLGDVCRKAPSQTAVRAISDAVTAFAKADK